MRSFSKLFSMLCAAVLGSAVAAQDLALDVSRDSTLHSLDTAQEARGWEGVGRLDIADKGFCSAALIDSRLILTAAHCVFDTDGTLLDPSRFTFRAGLRSGRAEVERGVRRFVTHPSYSYPGPTPRTDTVGDDIALLELDQPIRSTRVRPFDTAAAPRAGDTVGIVSYAMDRESAPSRQEVCSVLGERNAMLVMTCEINFGASGAPVFQMIDGVPRIVSVISAMAQMDGQDVSLGTSLGQPLAELRAAFADLGPSMPAGVSRVVVSGAGSRIGTRFVQIGNN